MTEHSAQMGNSEFDRLIAAMPSIAEAVSKFPDEALRGKAFDLLIGAMGVAGPILRDGPPVEADPEPAESEARADAPAAVPELAAPAKAPRRKRGAKKWEPVRDIDFRPEGKQSFKALVAEKEPKTIDQKNAVAVYWLEQVAGIQEIGVGQVLAAYKECDWREPSDPANSLQATASREHWIDTKSMKAIATTPSGRNLVKHDMPLKQKAA